MALPVEVISGRLCVEVWSELFCPAVNRKMGHEVRAFNGLGMLTAMDGRKRRERDFHNLSYSDGRRASLSKFYSTTNLSRHYYYNKILNICWNKRILECGCGNGVSARKFAQSGGFVHAIDISDVGIRFAMGNSRGMKLSERVTFQVMDVEKLAFSNNSFDIVCGTGILHHLQIESAFKEIARVLKPEGVAMFLEPLGHNPIINLYRKLTPHLRTTDEHPLIVSDFLLAQELFKEVEIKYFHLFSIFAFPLRRFGRFELVVSLLDWLDAKLFSLIPKCGPYAWFAVLECRRPIK